MLGILAHTESNNFFNIPFADKQILHSESLYNFVAVNIFAIYPYNFHFFFPHFFLFFGVWTIQAGLNPTVNHQKEKHGSMNGGSGAQ